MDQEAQNLNFSRDVPPSLEQVQAYFNSLHVPAAEAEVSISITRGWTGVMNQGQLSVTG